MIRKKYVICKTCGYIMPADQVHDVCPACGVPAQAFEPYKPAITKNRQKILSMHLHPIILHFPQAVVVFALLLLLIMPFTSGSANEFITTSAKFNTYLLPLCILGGFLSGVLDGKVRFKSVKTPILKFKIMLSVLFLALSLAAAVILGTAAEITGGINVLLILIMLISTACAVVLGKIGSKLNEAIYPG